MAFFDYQIREMTVLEKRILLVASVLPPKLITLKQLREFVPYGKEEEFQDTILILLSKGWLEADKDRFRVPRLVQMVLHKKLKPTPNKLKRYLRLLTEKLEKRTIESLKWLPFAQYFVRYMTQLTPEVANLALIIGQILDGIGAQRSAVEFYQYAVSVYEILATQSSQEEMIELVTKLWFRIGDIEKALFFAHQLLEIREVYQENTIVLADTYQLLAQIYAFLQDYENAIKYADNALDIYTMLLDENDPRLKEMKQFHADLSKAFKDQTSQQDKRQWLRRLFF